MTTQTREELQSVILKLEHLVADCEKKVLVASSLPDKTLADEQAIGLLAGIGVLGVVTTRLARVVRDISTNPNP